MNLIEKTLNSNIKYKGEFLTLYKDEVELKATKKKTTREYIHHPGAALMIARFKNNDILLVKQFRYSLKKICLEIPAGKIDKGEKPYQTAKRELIEETGYEANKITKITMFHPCIGYSDEKMHLYLVEDLSKKESKTKDPDEIIELIRLPYQKALDLVNSGKVIDLKSIASILLIKSYFTQNNSNVKK